MSTASSAARYAGSATAYQRGSGHPRYWSSCQLGVGRSSSSARPPFVSAYVKSWLCVVPVDLEEPFLDAMVEPRAAEDELLQPVDERLAADERERVPVRDEVLAERAARLRDRVALDELDEVGGLVGVELGRGDEPEPDGGGRDPLLEIERC